MYYVYILECADTTLYTGITTDVARRFKEHHEKKGAAYTRTHGAKQIVYVEECPDRAAASKREISIKKLSRKEKWALVAGTLHEGEV